MAAGMAAAIMAAGMAAAIMAAGMAAAIMRGKGGGTGGGSADEDADGVVATPRQQHAPLAPGPAIGQADGAGS